jgi:hypothetical protein
VAEERILQRQVRVTAGQPLPATSPDAMGAGLGRALEQAGQIIHQERIEDARLDRSLRENAELSRFNVEFAAARDEFSDVLREARKSDEPGHRQRVQEAWEERQQRLLDGLQSPRVREQASAGLANWSAGVLSRESDWEDLRQSQITVDRLEEFLAVSDGRIRRLENNGDYEAEMLIRENFIKGLDNVSDEVRAKMLDASGKQGAISLLRGLIDRDPEGTKVMIGSGAFDFLGGDKIEALGNSADVEIRRVQAQRERENREAVAAIKTDIAVFKQRQSMGLVDEDEAFDAAITKAAAIGDEKLVLELVGLKAENAFTKVWGPQNATALQREQRMTQLQRQAKLDDGEKLELAFLQKNAPAWAAEENRDATGQQMRRGGTGAPPPINEQDGASWNARAAWAGVRDLPVFSDQEARNLRELAETPQGEVRVLAELDKVADPIQRDRAATQIMPNDGLFRMMAMVHPSMRAKIREGQKVLAKDSKFLNNKLGNKPAALDDMDAAISIALKDFGIDQRRSIEQAYRAIMAGTVSASGATNMAGFGDDEFARGAENAVRSASGGVRRNGVWQGGLERWNDQWFMLPGGVSKAGFKQRLIRELERQKDNPPVNPDGSPVNLYRLIPVAVGGGWYRWESAGGAIAKDKSGKVFRTRIGP